MIQNFIFIFLCFFVVFPAQSQTKDSYYYMLEDGEFSSEEKDDEAVYIHEECSSNIIQSTYFNCECIAGAYRQARDEGPIQPQANLLYSIFDKKAKECMNKPAIAGDAYSFCEDHVRIFRSRESGNTELCECVARKTVKDFAKEPKLSTDFMADLQIDALLSCQNIN